VNLRENNKKNLDGVGGGNRPLEGPITVDL